MASTAATVFFCSPGRIPLRAVLTGFFVCGGVVQWSTRREIATQGSREFSSFWPHFSRESVGAPRKLSPFVHFMPASRCPQRRHNLPDIGICTLQLPES